MSLMLEVFNGDQGEPMRGPEHSSLYKMGYDAGVAAAKDAQNAEEQKLNFELVQTISDIQFSYMDARAHLVEQFSKVFSSVLFTVLPAASLLSLRETLLETIGSALNADGQQPLTLTVSESDFPALTLVFNQNDFPMLKIVPDRSLSSGAAAFQTGSYETALDIPSALQEISSAFEAMHEMMTSKELL